MKQLSLIKNKRKKKPGPKKRSNEISHLKREVIDSKKPIHLTLRVVNGLPKLRQKRGFQIFKRAIGKAKKFGLNIVHFNIENNHLHIIAEAKDNLTLAKGMQSFSICFAKQLKRWMVELLGPRGAGMPFFLSEKRKRFLRRLKISANYKNRSCKIFEGRYHLHILRSPSEVKRALKYVLLNASKHFQKPFFIDPYSSAAVFEFWGDLLGATHAARLKVPEWIGRFRLEDLGEPKTWLLHIGWLRAKG